QAPELSRAGGAIVAHPLGSPGGYLVANTGAGYLALRAECPHEGCEVAWVLEDRQVERPGHGWSIAGDGTLLNPPARPHLTGLPAASGLQCPVHDSRFDLTGGFLQGPAGSSLLRYAVAFDGTTVMVSTTPRA